jgi:hypothetical protein
MNLLSEELRAKIYEIITTNRSDISYCIPLIDKHRKKAKKELSANNINCNYDIAFILSKDTYLV